LNPVTDDLTNQSRYPHMEGNQPWEAVTVQTALQRKQKDEAMRALHLCDYLDENHSVIEESVFDLQQKRPTLAQNNSLKEHSPRLSPSPAIKGRVAVSVQDPLNKERHDGTMQTLPTDRDYLDENHSVIDQSVFGLHGSGISHDVEQARSEPGKTDESMHTVLVTPSAIKIERLVNSNTSPVPHESSVDERISSETAWVNRETNQNFVSGLATLKANPGALFDNRPRQATKSTAEGKDEKDTLCQGSNTDSGNGTALLSDEFRDAIDGTFSAGDEADDYGIAYSHHVLERIPQDVKQNVVVSDPGNIALSPLAAVYLFDDSDNRTGAEKLVQRLRQGVQKDSSSDVPSLRSQFIVSARSVDARSARSWRATTYFHSEGRSPPRSSRSTMTRLLGSSTGSGTLTHSSNRSVQSNRNLPHSGRTPGWDENNTIEPPRRPRRRGKTPPSRRRLNSACDLSFGSTSKTPRSCASSGARSQSKDVLALSDEPVSPILLTSTQVPPPSLEGTEVCAQPIQPNRMLMK
jgi:hypothetical protein